MTTYKIKKYRDLYAIYETEINYFGQIQKKRWNEMYSTREGATRLLTRLGYKV